MLIFFSLIFIYIIQVISVIILFAISSDSIKNKKEARMMLIPWPFLILWLIYWTLKEAYKNYKGLK